MGGQNYEEFSDTVWLLDLLTREWSALILGFDSPTVDSGPKGRTGHTATALLDGFLITAGRSNNGLGSSRRDADARDDMTLYKVSCVDPGAQLADADGVTCVGCGPGGTRDGAGGVCRFCPQGKYALPSSQQCLDWFCPP